MRRLLSSLLMSSSLLSGIALAEQQLRPGLWEHSMKTGQDGGQLASAMTQMQQQLATMPAQQRQMIEKMMADKGLSFGSQGTSVKVCMTKEDVARKQFPARDGCTQDARRSGDTWQVSFQCKGNPPSSGEGVIRIVSPTDYTGEFTLNVIVDGKPERVNMMQSGTWLAADCGQTRPTRP